MQVLSIHLTCFPRLERLALASNAIRPDGMKSLSTMLPRLQHLVDLQLPCNFIGDAGVAALAPAVKQLAALTRLELQVGHRDVCNG